MLKQRMITAVILIPLVLIALLYLPDTAFAYATLALILGCAWEWTNLMGLRELHHKFAYFFIFTVLCFGTLFIPIHIILMAAFFWWLAALILLLLYPDHAEWANSMLLRGIMGFLVIIPTWVAINYIRAETSVYDLLFLLVLIWGADSFAYFGGKQWGKHKIAPLISPGKTWEGFASALVGCLILSVIVFYSVGVPASVWVFALPLSLITVCFSLVGDLFESMLKRNVGIKDSGKILPGHGGLLDRLDSLTSAGPIFALGINLMAVYFTH